MVTIQSRSCFESKVKDLYSTPFEYLTDEFDFIYLTIQNFAIRLGRSIPGISDSGKNDVKNQISANHKKLQNKRKEIDDKLKRSTIIQPLQILNERFNLDTFEQHALLLCLAGYLDQSFREAYAVLNRDPSKTLSVFLTGTKAPDNAGYEIWNELLFLEIPIPDRKTSFLIWSRQLSQKGIILPPESIETLAAKYRLTPTQISSIVNSIDVNSPETMASENVLHSLKSQLVSTNTLNLSAFASRILSPYTWDDLILPDRQKKMLKEICIFMKHREKVMLE